MKLIFYLMVVTILINCTTQEKLILEGTAIDAKAGAIIITSNDSIYYVEGIERWKENILDHTVRVKGYIKRVVNDPDSLFYYQGMYKQTIITKPKVKVLGTVNKKSIANIEYEIENSNFNLVEVNQGISGTKKILVYSKLEKYEASGYLVYKIKNDCKIKYIKNNGMSNVFVESSNDSIVKLLKQYCFKGPLSNR